MTVAQGFSPAIRARLRPRLFLVPALLAAATFAVSIRYGAFIAGGSDSYCYVSQARLWTTGWPVVQEPLITQTTALGRWTFVPLGYRPGPAFGTFVPICSIGFPLTMAAFSRLFGAGAELYVVPLAAAGLVFLTGWIGRRIGGDAAGIASSALVATSPIFVFQSLQPMSDVPAACLWLLSAALALDGRVWALTAAVPALALAILTRPNLAPLGLPLLAFALMARMKERRRDNWIAAAAIAIGLALGAGIVAYANSVLHGAPLSSGYGAPDRLYRLGYFWTNVRRYAEWLFEAETVLIVLTAGGIARMAFGNTLQRRWAWFSSAMLMVVCVSYVFYEPFEDWTYLRFLLPAFPLAFIAYASLTTRPLLVVLLTVPILAGHIYFITKRDVMRTRTSEGRYLDAAAYINASLPANAVFISAQHSGSVRFYTGRKTLRFDWLAPRDLDDALKQMSGLGYKPYLLLEHWEEDWFTSRFRRNPLSRLDWPPLVEIPTPMPVRIYDPAER